MIKAIYKIVSAAGGFAGIDLLDGGMADDLGVFFF